MPTTFAEWIEAIGRLIDLAGVLAIALGIALVVALVAWFRARKSAGADSEADAPTGEQPPPDGDDAGS